MPTIKTYSNGTKTHLDGDGRLHRLDGPAIEWANGDYYWYKDGKLHRTDGPAIKTGDMVCWYFNDTEIKSEILDKYFNDPANPTADEVVIMKMHETFSTAE